MLNLNADDWKWIVQHYEMRFQTHKLLRQLHRDALVAKYSALAVGADNPEGNYSANEHALGPQILLNRNANLRVFELAKSLLVLTSAEDVPRVVELASLDYLKIGVGSEIACMLEPSICWVGNKKTVWSYLAESYGSSKLASELIGAYQDAGIAQIYWQMKAVMTKLSLRRPIEETSLTLESDNAQYLWADAICCRMHDIYK